MTGGDGADIFRFDVIDIIENKAKVILPGAPWTIAHKSTLKINEPYKFTLNQQDYVIWKDHHDEVFALENICPHMQAPLSDGWICREGNTIACPFHGLRFDSEGKLRQDKKLQTKSLVQPLKLIVREDIVWTYGNHQPRLPIPDLIPNITEEYQFLGVAGEKTIQAPFLNCLKINYDFNHAIATHREPFKFDEIIVNNYRKNDYYTTLDQEVIRSKNTWQELITNPALLTVPKILRNHFEYAFPSTIRVGSQTFLGELLQFFILYPETETVTKTFILVYLKPKSQLNRFLSYFIKSYFLKYFNLIIEQDSGILETLYPPQKPEICLPREEIMVHADKLYSHWNQGSLPINS